jgi:hypothetical protein
LAGGSSLGEAVVATCSADEEDGMFIVGPLWLILLILLFTRPVRAFKLLFGFLFGAVIGLGFWMVVIAAYGSALAETLACSTTFQDYRVCQGPSGYRSTETPWQGMTIGQDNRGGRWSTSRWQGFDTTIVEPR